MKTKKINRFLKINYFLRKFYTFKFLNFFFSEDYLRKKIFKYIFFSGYWSDYNSGVSKSVSGKGSNYDNTLYLKNELKTFFREKKIKKILDIGCGDFNWMSNLLKDIAYESYLGVDIVKNLVDDNSEKYGSKKVKFLCHDIVSENIDFIDEFDFILVRHVFIHLKNSNIIKVLNKIKKINFKYLAITSDPYRYSNVDLKTEGRYRDINLIIEPFNLSVPSEIIKESAPGVLNNVDLNIYNNSIKLK
jgi:SAM-dependent methyltransferase